MIIRNSVNNKASCRIITHREVDGEMIKTKYIEFRSKYCWCCGIKMKRGKKNYDDNIGTIHHMIPKSLNPINNIEIPLCWKCHKEIHKINKKDVPTAI